MAKLAAINVNAWNDKDRSIMFTHAFECHVNSAGVFQTFIPEHFVDQFTTMVEAWDGNGRPKMDKTPRNYKDVLETDTRALAERVCNEFGRSQVTATLSHELLIFYNKTADVSYWLNDDGSMHSNGYDYEGGGGKREGSWCDSDLHANNKKRSYKVGFGARVVKVLTITDSKGNKTVKHEHPEDKLLGVWGQQLNAFMVHLDTAPTAWDVKQQSRVARYPHLPYTEDTAKWCYELTMTLCRLSRGMDDFFGDGPEDLLANIASDQKLLGMSS